MARQLPGPHGRDRPAAPGSARRRRLISRKALRPSVSGPEATAAVPVAVPKCNLDLREEAHQFFRRQIRVAGTGLVLGGVFVGIGVFGVGAQAASGLTPAYVVALLLAVLGLAVIAVSLRSGLLNPVTRVRGNASGVTFERRWGRPLSWAWKDPEFRLDIDDRTLDPVGSAESHQHLFFEGPGPIYGNLTPTTIGPLLDTARACGVPISMKQFEQREGGRVHLVRRIRIRPRPIR